MEEVEYFLRVENLQYKVNQYFEIYATRDESFFDVVKLHEAIKKFEGKYKPKQGKKNGHFTDCVSSNKYVTTVLDTCICVLIYVHLYNIKSLYKKVCHILK